GLPTRGVSGPIEPRWLQLLRLSLVLCVASPLGGR
ncbi:exlusion protein FxsA, partial [Vibrio cholerae]|nr:exlusion protein FxsA [Vibrio cholerae]